MTIRAYQNGDFGALADIYAQSKLDELSFERKRFQLLPLARDNKRLRELMESSIFVYDDKGILGYGAVFEDEIRALFVHPLSRGRGIGTDLLTFLISQIDTTPRLYVAKSNAAAKALYQKYGFSVSREFETVYNGQPVMANEMVRKGT